jgi:diaminohydroxyphosphoribosylaminopyrimidine deaminase/5-amino-6-(5-phosphoribosylamino)uracil reductase
VSLEDERFMAMAVEQARAAMGTTAPNPSVGAVLVRDGTVLGVGHTRPVGGAHAEVACLQAVMDAGPSAEGATMYVTLEPCRHVGRTPPCTRALIDAGVARVVVGSVDPFPPMRGKGLDDLRSAGVSVDLGLRREACDAVVRGFARAVTHGLPEVTLKIATSLDGNIATASGESQWITGPDARMDGHRLRANHDAILVGVGTVLADNPRLTVRGVPGTHPVPIILDSRLRTPVDAAVFSGTQRVLIICAEDAPEVDLPADIVRVPRGDGGVDMHAAMIVVAQRGLHRVLIEGGGRIARSVLDARLVDEVVLYQSGRIVPGGRPWVGGEPLVALAKAITLTVRSAGMLGPDVVLRYGALHRVEG